MNNFRNIYSWKDLQKKIYKNDVAYSVFLLFVGVAFGMLLLFSITAVKERIFGGSVSGKGVVVSENGGGMHGAAEVAIGSGTNSSGNAGGKFGVAAEDLGGVGTRVGVMSGTDGKDLDGKIGVQPAGADLSSDVAISFFIGQNTFEDNTLLKTEKNLTRAELVYLLSQVYGSNPHKYINSFCFKDVNDEWFARFVCSAKGRGWVSGYKNNMFFPEREVSYLDGINVVLKAYGVSVDSAKISSELKQRGWIPLTTGDADFGKSMTNKQLFDLLYKMYLSGMTLKKF